MTATTVSEATSATWFTTFQPVCHAATAKTLPSVPLYSDVSQMAPANRPTKNPTAWTGPNSNR